MTEEDRPTAATKAALMQRDIDTIKRDVADIKANIANQYVQTHQLELIRLSITEQGIKIADMRRVQDANVTHKDFWPVKMIVYGMVGLILTAVIVALLSGVIIKTPSEQSERPARTAPLVR